MVHPVCQRAVTASTVAVAAGFALGACGGPESALDPAGVNAERIADLTWIMFAAAAAIWITVMGIAVYAMRIRPDRHRGSFPKRLIVWGGIVFPTTVLAGLLAYGLALMPDLRQPGEGLRVEVAGEQWWWRVHYWPEGAAEPVESANEIRLPVGSRVEMLLESPDVIHSFWIPSLAGKMDMIPGRTNRLVLEPTRTGTYRGVCAEFCGTSHALMAFAVEVMEQDDFARWLDEQAQPAEDPATPAAAAGAELFLASGCGSCHRVRGTSAQGSIGPDLTHVGDRLTLGAGILPNTEDAFVEWIGETETVKPGSRMPSFAALGPRNLAAIAAYLDGLK